MSKTFKNATNEGTEVYVGEGINAGSVQLVIRNVGEGIGKAGIYLNSSDIPALALAILEAAGVPWNVDTPLGRAAVELDKHVTLEAKATAEAEAQAVLEAEALELCNAWREANGYDALSSFSDGAPIGAMAEWLAVARRARELNKENQ